MPKPVAAFLRRYCALLDWINLEKSDAIVSWKSEEVGTWRTIQARWSLTGARLRFQFRLHNRVVASWVTSIKSGPGGASIQLENPRKSAPGEIRILWEEKGVESQGPTSLSGLSETAQHWLRKKLPGCVILLVGRRSDRTHTLSGSYLRIYARHCGNDYLLVACPPSPAELAVSPLLTNGLHWMHYLHARKLLRGVPTLYLMVPLGLAGVLYHRARCMNAERIKVEVWEYESKDGEWEARQAGPPPPPEENQDFRWPLLGPFRWSALLGRVLELAPDLMRRHPRFQDYDSLRLFGLEFAQVLGADRDRIQFGVGSQGWELSDDNFESLRSLVDEIVFYRRPDTPDPHHAYYRIQSERWLECLILEEAPRIFPELAPEAVYSQIPVYLGEYSGRVDILGIDHDGTLVVMELKVSEDPDLPMQALDYWGRVIQHNLRGDFQRRGYFGTNRLNRRWPKVYLVSPVFSFHDSTERVLGYMEPDLEVWKIAINEDWRNGVKILRRKRLRCGDLV